MGQNRRTFLKSAGMAAAVVSAAPLSASFPAGNTAAAAPGAAGQRGADAANFFLELGGRPAGAVLGFQGGNAFADVVEFASGNDSIVNKTLGDIHYEEIMLVTGLAMDSVLWNWISQTLAGRPEAMDGAIVMADANLNVVRRLEFHNALLTELALPALDAASNAAGRLTIRLQPESTAVVAASGKANTAAAVGTKPWMESNFRVAVGDLPCGRVNRVEAFSIKQQVAEFREGGGGIRLLPGKLQVSNLALTVSATDGGPWQAFFDDFVLNGNNGDANELDGALELLAPNAGDVLARLELSNLGIFRLALEEVDPGTTSLQRLRAELYVEGTRLFVGGLN